MRRARARLVILLTVQMLACGGGGGGSGSTGSRSSASGSGPTASGPAAINHVVIIVQENRTPDNLFQGLCAPPFGNSDSCSTAPNSSQYNIQTDNWLDRHSLDGVIQPKGVPLDPNYDPDHSHTAFVAMCDPDAAGVCRMDGAGDVVCSSTFFACSSNASFVYVDNSEGAVNPYLELATQYGWANYMFQTNQGPSFPAHQYIFGGTSAPTAPDDRAGIFAAENGNPSMNSGCISAADVTIELIDPTGENALTYPCFEHQGIADLLPANITWRYYTPPGPAIWNAPIAIAHICQSSGPGGRCTGAEWFKNVDLNPAHVLGDIRDCNLRSLSWVVPTGGNSDHPGGGDKGGPSWVASIVNAIGNSSSCDNHTGYWKNTAVLITWDDWGGWYDHERPTILSSVQGDYERGFRVPLIVVSAYTPRGYIENGHLDFGSLLRFVEGNFNIALGALGFADARSDGNLNGFFNLSAPPRTYRTIAAPKSASFFLNDKRPMTAPDND